MPILQHELGRSVGRADAARLFGICLDRYHILVVFPLRSNAMKVTETELQIIYLVTQRPMSSLAHIQVGQGPRKDSREVEYVIGDH